MSVRAFVPYPNACLRSVASPISSVDADVLALMDDMVDTMYAMPGVGLAAPQIGVMQRVAVVDCSAAKNEPLCLANPEIIDVSQTMQVFDEGSPNLPGVHAKIERPDRVTFTYLDRSGTRVRSELKGLWATSLMHQIDHLNGKLFFDHLSATKRKMLIAKSAKLIKKGLV